MVRPKRDLEELKGEQKVQRMSKNVSLDRARICKSAKLVVDTQFWLGFCHVRHVHTPKKKNNTRINSTKYPRYLSSDSWFCACNETITLTTNIRIIHNTQNSNHHKRLFFVICISICMQNFLTLSSSISQSTSTTQSRDKNLSHMGHYHTWL